MSDQKSKDIILLQNIAIAAQLASDTAEDHTMVPERHRELMEALAKIPTLRNNH